MYLDYYRLKREPFYITPDPAFLFLSESHKQAMATIVYGIGKKKGFMVITGGSGVGKTMIARACLARSDSKYLRTVYVFNTKISFADLLEIIFQQLGLPVTTDTVTRMVTDLNLFLIDEHKAGRTVVLIIDEAQNLPVETLDNLRILSNFETEEEKLIQIVLIGQPDLDSLLVKDELHHLKQRIALRTNITALTPVESSAYIEHRLAKAGARDASIFTKTALDLLIKEARGVPRTINVLCDNALITAFGYKEKTVTSKIVNEVIADFNGHTRYFPLRWQTATLVMALFLIVAFAFAFRNDNFGSLWTQKQTHIKQVQPASKQLSSAIVADQGAPRQANTQTAPEQTPMKAVPTATITQDAPEQKNSQVTPKRTPPKTETEPTKTMAKIRVKDGDSFIQLTKEFYGRSDTELLKLVKGKNPHIKDVHKLRPGSVVYFPQISDAPQSP